MAMSPVHNPLFSFFVFEFVLETLNRTWNIITSLCNLASKAGRIITIGCKRLTKKNTPLREYWRKQKQKQREK
jgi:hypothetical protein